MIRVICVVRDIKADAYGQPMFVQSTGVALRSFTDEVNRASEDNMLYQHPEDFELFTVGTFNDETCQFDVHVPRSLAIGSDVKR